MRSKSLTYMPALDGLRGVAVLMVFVQHAFPWVVIPGGLGVDVFFIISGWLITRILLKEYRASGRIRLGRFYLKRFLRLYPVLLTVIVTFIALWFTLGQSLGDVLGWSFWAATYLSNIAVTGDISTLGHLLPTWSLAMEEQFYLLWPIVLIGLLSMKLPVKVIVVMLGVGAVLSLGFLFTVGLPYSPISRSSGILIGCAAAFLVEKKPWQSTSAGIISALVIAGLFVANVTHAANYSVVMIATVALTPFVLLHAAFGESILTRILSAKWLVYIGLISYGLYLWHYPIIKALIATTDLAGGPRGVLAFALSLIAASATYYLVERPFNRIKDRVGAKEKTADPMPAATPVTP